MDKQKVLNYAIGIGVVGYAGYWIWKNKDKIKSKFKEYFPDKVEVDLSDVVTYEELQARRELRKMELEAEKRTTHIEGLGDLNPEDLTHTDEWYEENGRWVRELSTVEKVNGIDYDPETEELLEYYRQDGSVHVRVAKLEKLDKLRNFSEKRSINDILESVEDYADAIYILNKQGDNNAMDMRATYASDSLERLDYFYAMQLDIHGVQDAEVRRKLINLFTWDYIPNQYNMDATNLFEIIKQTRVEFFGYGSPFIERVSVAEIILYFAERYEYNLGNDRYTMEDFITFMVNNIPLNFDGSEHDAIINDTLISYMEHGRSLHPNVTGGFGLFGLKDEDYESRASLTGEFEESLGYLLEDYDYKLPLAKYNQGATDE